jgi:CheY-like chemotaxis protein
LRATKKPNVLLVDDTRSPENIWDPATRGFFKAEDVVVARTVDDGIKLLQEQPWHVLLLDHDMGPGRNGYDVLRYLMNNHEDFHPVAIYLVTHNTTAGENMLADLRTMKASGAIEDYGWVRFPGTVQT